MRTEDSLQKVLFPSFSQKTENPNYTNFWRRISVWNTVSVERPFYRTPFLYNKNQGPQI